MRIITDNELIKSQLRKRFAKVGLGQKTSSYHFLNELREAGGTFMKRSNIILVNYIINGIKVKDKLEKSFALNLQVVLLADDLLLKATFGEMRKKVSSYLKKFLKKPPSPKRKIQVVYDTEEKDDLTRKEWKNIEDIIYFYLKDEQNPAMTEMLKEAYQMGMQSGEMYIQGEKDSHASYSYDQMKHWQEEHDLAEKFQKEGMGQDWAYAAVWAKEKAAEHLAIYQDGERKGKAYDRLTEMFREQIREGLEKGEDYSKLRSRLIFPERWTDVEGHQKNLSEVLSPEEISQYSVAHLNRDWERFAFNEFQSAFNNGKLLRWSKFDKAYVKFTRVRNKGKSCEFCASHRDTICRLFPTQEAFTNSEFYGGADVVQGDEMASVAVWPGKNNVDRSENSWWIAAPSHPWCNDDFTFVG